MKRRYHKWYGQSYLLNEKLGRKFTGPGAAVFISAFSLLFFGLNTHHSMLFVVFSVAVSLIITDAGSLLLKFPDYKITRYLPPYISKGKQLQYSVSIKNGHKIYEEDLFYKEIPEDPRPSYESFSSTPEPGEEKRNRYDRKMGYYRWKWLLEKNAGGEAKEITVAGEKINEESVFPAFFRPVRRGKIRFSGCYIFRKGIFGLFKKGKIINLPGEFIVFPEIFSVETAFCLNGLRNADTDKIRETPETGAGYELKSLRDYVPGDSPRSIHWKSSAKTGQLKIKEFHKEVDAGTVLFIDNFFTESFLEDFETVLSVAASLLNYLYETERMPQAVILGKSIYEIPSPSKDNLMRILTMLALAKNDKSADLMISVKNLTEIAQECCSVIFLTPVYDEKRYSMISSLVKHKVPVNVIFAGDRKTLLKPVASEKSVSLKDLQNGGLKL